MQAVSTTEIQMGQKRTRERKKEEMEKDIRKYRRKGDGKES